MDSAGDQHLHIDHNIYKRRVDLDGNPIEEAKKEEIQSSTTRKENVVRTKLIKSLIYEKIDQFVFCRQQKHLKQRTPDQNVVIVTVLN